MKKASPEKGQEKKEEKITYRTLGKTGIKLPVITMGVMNTSNPSLVRAALSNEMYFLDTAQVYQRGTNETMLGEVLKGRPGILSPLPPRRAFPTTRPPAFTRKRPPRKPSPKRSTPASRVWGWITWISITTTTFGSRESALYEPILNALVKAKKAGKIRFIGITTHRNEPEVINAAVDSKVYDVVLPAYNFRQKHAEEVKKAIARAAEAGLGVIAMKTIGGNVGGSYHNPQIDAPMALKWALQDPNVHTIIAGFTTFDQLESDLKVLERCFPFEVGERNPPPGGPPVAFVLPGMREMPGPVREAASHSRPDEGLHVSIRVSESGGSPGSPVSP